LWITEASIPEGHHEGFLNTPFVVVMLGIEPRALHMLGTSSTMELHPQLQIFPFLKGQNSGLGV
jgi:hypothetical protein